jgi:hypothetical protein
MAIRVKHTVVARTSRDTDFKLAMFNPDVDQLEIITDDFDKAANSNLAVPVSTKESLSFGDVDDVRGIMLEVSAACKLYINGSTDAIDMVLSGATSAPAKFFLEASISQIEVENESADTVLTGVYVIWGDPTP